MGFSLYSLIEAMLLCVNAVAILSEQRVLSRLSNGGNQNSGSVKQQLLTLIRSVRMVMRVPLIAFNMVAIAFLILFG